MSTQKASYVDGFVIVLKKKNLAAYRKDAKLGAELWKKHGALDYMECVGDDLNMKMPFNFPKMTRTKPDEIVVFSYITYASKKHRNEVNKKVMQDPRMIPQMDKPMPFDMKRFAYGGFKVLLSA